MILRGVQLQLHRPASPVAPEELVQLVLECYRSVADCRVDFLENLNLNAKCNINVVLNKLYICTCVLKLKLIQTDKKSIYGSNFLCIPGI